MSGMATVEQLEALSTRELRDRAFSRAKRRLDVAFFWRLLEAAPAAEAAAGHVSEAREDVMLLAQRVQDVVHPDTPEEEEAFRPIYIEYLADADEG